MAFMSHTLMPQLSQPHSTPAICLALYTCSLGVSVDLPGPLCTLVPLTSPGLTAVSGRCLVPSPLTLRSSRCPSQLPGESTMSQLGTQQLWGKGTLVPSPQLLAFCSTPFGEEGGRIERRTHP